MQKLSERKHNILKAVVEEYIKDAQPVSSGGIQKRHFSHISSATIRAELAALEDMGYLIQPHTSAGRRPTPKAYKYIEMSQIAEPYIKRRAVRHLEKGRVVIFAGGTGNPFFSTDTCAALRASEINADIILFGKTIDGVYDSDPKENPNAKKYETITYTEILKNNLKVIDSTAASLCRDNKIWKQ